MPAAKKDLKEKHNSHLVPKYAQIFCPWTLHVSVSLHVSWILIVYVRQISKHIFALNGGYFSHHATTETKEDNGGSFLRGSIFNENILSQLCLHFVA